MIKKNDENNSKIVQLEQYVAERSNAKLTTEQGVGVSDTDNSLKAGKRGPTLMQDFIFREKVTHFDHERIPERVVHARGSGAHGYFQCYQDMSNLTMAKFLAAPNKKTPVFVRFSTVAGFRGSPDTVRDVRGFAVKFYTEDGNYDLVGNNMPVFFIQDAIKFPDLIHALKPEQNNEMPQAASAHDTFWDFVTNNPETAHNVMWLMSDRAIPKSFRMMEGFGIHTFKLINEKGEVNFVKFHWKPILGVHSLVWDEAQKIAGKDPDFNRRDLWDSINIGQFPEFEFAIQVLPQKDEFKFDFDILDCTKLWPEEIIPIQKIGKLVLNKNVTNFFAETEQVAFCPANIVPGIDFTNDPMLQGRLFSYLDTQITRLGGPNFSELPINRPIVPVNNNERDGMHRMTINGGASNYFVNALDHGQPHPAQDGESAYCFDEQKVEGAFVRKRSDSFKDFYSQPRMFWNSMSPHEKHHIVDAFRFELGKVKNKDIRQAAVDMFNNVSGELAKNIASGIGATPPVEKKNAAATIANGTNTTPFVENKDETVSFERSMGATNSILSGGCECASNISENGTMTSANKTCEAAHAGKSAMTIANECSEALSMANATLFTKSRKVAVLVENGFDKTELDAVLTAFGANGINYSIVSSVQGQVMSTANIALDVAETYKTTAPMLFDSVFIPGGKHVDILSKCGDAVEYIRETFRHSKPIAVCSEAIDLLIKAGLPSLVISSDKPTESCGIVTMKNGKTIEQFVPLYIQAIAKGRFWERCKQLSCPLT